MRPNQLWGCSSLGPHRAENTQRRSGRAVLRGFLLAFGIFLGGAGFLHASIDSVMTFPAGNDSEVQINDHGVFGSTPSFHFDLATGNLYVASITCSAGCGGGANVNVSPHSVLFSTGGTAISGNSNFQFDDVTSSVTITGNLGAQGTSFTLGGLYSQFSADGDKVAIDIANSQASTITFYQRYSAFGFEHDQAIAKISAVRSGVNGGTSNPYGTLEFWTTQGQNTALRKAFTLSTGAGSTILSSVVPTIFTVGNAVEDVLNPTYYKTQLLFPGYSATGFLEYQTVGDLFYTSSTWNFNKGVVVSTMVVNSSITISGAMISGGSAGASGKVWTSNGDGAAPTWQTASGGSISISTLTAGATNFLQNTNSLQSGSTFFVSSGSISGKLNVGDRVQIGTAPIGDNLTYLSVASTNTSTYGKFISAAGTVQFANFNGAAYMQAAPGFNAQMYAGTGPGVLSVGSSLTTLNTAFQNSSYFYATTAGVPGYAMNSAGTNYGMIQNDAADVWSLGTGTSLTALGSPILQWTKSGNITAYSLSASTSVLNIKGAAAQSGNYLNLRNSADTILTHFDSNGDLTFDHTNGHIFWASNALSIYHDGGNGSVQNTIGGFNFNNTAATGAMSFGTNNVTRMYIKSTGEVGIGTTTPGGQLEVDGTSNTAVVQIIRGAASQTADLWELKLSSGVTVASFTANGSLVTSSITATTAFIFSDGTRQTTAASASVTATSSITFSGLDVFNNYTNFITTVGISGIIVSTGPKASVNSCGPGTTMRGGFTGGAISVAVAVVTSCVIDFPSPTIWPIAPSCFPNDRGSTSVTLSASATTTQLTINASASMGGATIDYWCHVVP